MSTTNDLKRGLEAVGLALETDPASAPAILDAMQARLDASRVREETRRAWTSTIARARKQADAAIRRANPSDIGQPLTPDRASNPIERIASAETVTAAVRVYVQTAAAGLDTQAALAVLLHVAPEGVPVSDLVFGVDQAMEEHRARQTDSRARGESPRSRT